MPLRKSTTSKAGGPWRLVPLRPRDEAIKIGAAVKAQKAWQMLEPNNSNAATISVARISRARIGFT